ncbi:unnamed protein product [Sphagnum jensenii]|uniref:Uncharacterized protein n=2 Tax=Sphagnum jensenii TaxID=128206 RepID=A0ABP0WSX3_9BRYO
MDHAFKDYVAGLAAGVATVVIGHPFDTVKVRLQVFNTQAHAYKQISALECTARILKAEGVKGLYKGATSAFVGVALESSVLFGAYSQAKAALQGQEEPGRKPSLYAVVPAAAFAGASVSAIVCPTELVKCRLQVQEKRSTIHVPGVHHYDGPFDCVRKIVKYEGIRGLFRGAVATTMRESIGNVFFFGTYEITRSYLFSCFGLDASRRSKAALGDAEPVSMQASFSDALLETGIGIVTGGLAGTVFWLSVLPLDVAKTRIQTAIDLNVNRNPFYQIRLVYRQAGLKALYAGIGPTLARAFPANAAAIVTWELTARLLNTEHFRTPVT